MVAAAAPSPSPLHTTICRKGIRQKTVQTTTLMAEQELAFASEEGTYAANLTEALSIDEGKTYAVNWDGAEYKCICSISGEEGTRTLGNLSIIGMGHDTGEPFVYINIPDVVIAFNTLDTAASHTISVKRTEETVTPMAAEFFPSEINELIMNSSTAGSTKKFRITVDDSGTLKATEI